MRSILQLKRVCAEKQNDKAAAKPLSRIAFGNLPDHDGITDDERGERYSPRNRVGEIERIQRRRSGKNAVQPDEAQQADAAQAGDGRQQGIADAAKLSDALMQAGEMPSAQEAADFYQAEVFKDMAELRLAVDEMETLTARACWPYPTYGELLFSVR